jgi:hypothetical protein
MAEAQDTKPVPEAPQFSDATKAKARQWFEKGRNCGERREYDYSIECFITGLSFWPEAVEDGHKPLRAVAFARTQAGGKKPGTMEKLKKPHTGKDAKQCMLNAEFLMSKDPANGGFVDDVLKNANRAGLNEAAQWAAPIVFESLRKDKKPSAARFRAFRRALVECAERADAQGNHAMASWFYEQAVKSLDYLVARNPTDMALKTEQRNVSGRLTIARGKYEEADSFRESLQDGESQKLLHDADRVKQGDQTVDALIAAARKGLEAHPNHPAQVNALVEALCRREQKAEEDEAIRLLLAKYQELRNYSFKIRADDIRLKQLARQTRELRQTAERDANEANRQQVRLSETELLQAELDVFSERCAKYPTDLRLKYRLGSALFKSRRFDEGIPILQAAQADPKSRVRCQLLIGRSFYERESYTQAREVLKEALDEYEISGDEIDKLLTYWLGRACEAEGRTDEAVAIYGKLVRMDYDYAAGDVRKRLDALK